MLEAWLGLSNVNYHRNLWVSIPLDQWLALTILRVKRANTVPVVDALLLLEPLKLIDILHRKFFLFHFFSASTPLESLVHDYSTSVDKIFQRLDTRIEGASCYDYEVIGNHFGHDHYEIRSRFEKSVGGPSRAMIEVIVVRYPELTVEQFARVVEEQTPRKDVARLLRAYDRDSLNKSGDFSLSLE